MKTLSSFQSKSELSFVDTKSCIILIATFTAIQDLLLDCTMNMSEEGLEKQRIRFYHKGGSSAVISRDGTFAFRHDAINGIDYAGLLTNRPLMDNELFEVRVDKNLENDGGYPMGIGVTTHAPGNLTFPKWMQEIPDGTWMLYDKDLHESGKIVGEIYGQGHHFLKPGDTVGVMRTEAGALYYFINGVNQGLAANNIPSSVYGVIDLTRNIAQVTIVDK